MYLGYQIAAACFSAPLDHAIIFVVKQTPRAPERTYNVLPRSAARFYCTDFLVTWLKQDPRLKGVTQDMCEARTVQSQFIRFFCNRATVTSLVNRLNGCMARAMNLITARRTGSALTPYNKFTSFTVARRYMAPQSTGHIRRSRQPSFTRLLL